jgi:DNA-binding transcriptional LysR family regulator
MNLRRFDLNLLVALDVLLTERNVTRAGERLFLSQPAMSGILARLRHAFEDELLVRVGRNLELTARAEELAGPVHACVQQIEDLLNLQRPFAADTAQWAARRGPTIRTTGVSARASSARRPTNRPYMLFRLSGSSRAAIQERVRQEGLS